MDTVEHLGTDGDTEYAEHGGQPDDDSDVTIQT